MIQKWGWFIRTGSLEWKGDMLSGLLKIVFLPPETLPWADCWRPRRGTAGPPSAPPSPPPSAPRTPRPPWARGAGWTCCRQLSEIGIITDKDWLESRAFRSLKWLLDWNFHNYSLFMNQGGLQPYRFMFPPVFRFWFKEPVVIHYIWCHWFLKRPKVGLIKPSLIISAGLSLFRGTL